MKVPTIVKTSLNSPRRRYGVPRGSMLYISNFNVKEGRLKEFQTWTKKNEDLMQKHAPAGWMYRGTYAYVLGFGRYMGATIWECKKYSDFDNWREHKDETWMRLGEDFGDLATNEPGESVLLREIGDTKIIEKPVIEEAKSRRSH